ncbi:MAG TPA: hypothetical protein VE821_12115, partial [Pyrinomonadaceae bacterium]|nr:hypothetical protein [Pyrinomonadaceae bacterium]
MLLVTAPQQTERRFALAKLDAAASDELYGRCVRRTWSPLFCPVPRSLASRQTGRVPSASFVIISCLPVFDATRAHVPELVSDQRAARLARLHVTAQAKNDRPS